MINLNKYPRGTHLRRGHRISAVLMLMIAAVMLMSPRVYAEAAKKVCDCGGLLTESEERELEATLSDASSETGQDIIIYTVDSLENHSIEYMAETAAEEIRAGDSGILYIVAINDREYDIFTFGEMNNRVSAYQRDRLGEELRPYLSSGEYYKAFTRFCERAEELAGGEIYGGGGVSGSISVSLGGIFIGSAVISLIIVLVMRSGMKTTRPEISAGNYVRKGSFRLAVSRDIFLYSSLSRRRIDSDSGSHRSGGGHSSGGHRSGGHSSGKF